MRNYDTSRMIRLALAGAIAGLFIFLIFNPGAVRNELNRPTLSINPQDPFKAIEDYKKLIEKMHKAAPMDALIFTAAFAAMLGGMLVIADEFGSPPSRVAKKMLRAVASGALIGGTSGVIAECIFSALSSLSILFMLIARIVGWAVMGLGAGAGIGVTLGSTRRMQMSIYGGLIGGCIGAFLFDAVASATFAQTGSASRFIGFTVMGSVIGIAITFVEDIGKQNWLTVLSGPKEGRSYILTKPSTIIGKDELADIPLFGDVNVAKQHAQLSMIHYMVTLQAINGQMVMVNGSPVQTVQLKDSDTLQIGKFSLRFHQKVAQYAKQYVQQPMPQYQPQYLPYSQPQSTPHAPLPTIMQLAALPAKGILSLMVTAGPHLNQVFQFGPGVIKIGREDGYPILLAQDARVSRCHAEIVWDGQAWSVRDLNSTNGLWVNGIRVAQQALNVGDQIGVGQTLMIVDSI